MSVWVICRLSPYVCVCVSVQTTGVLLASWCVPVTTYWLLFGFVGYRGFVGHIVCAVCGKPTKNNQSDYILVVVVVP